MTAEFAKILIKIMTDLDHTDDLVILFPDIEVLGCRDQSLRDCGWILA